MTPSLSHFAVPVPCMIDTQKLRLEMCGCLDASHDDVFAHADQEINQKTCGFVLYHVE